MQARVLFVYLSVCSSAIDITGAVKYFCSQPNEVFLECGCHRNCRNPASDCGGICQKGCFCKGVELRDDDGDCVDPKYCPELPFDELLEPHFKKEPIAPRESNPPISYNEEDTSEPEEDEETESYTRKSYTLEPFGKYGIMSQTKKLYTYNPFYEEDTVNPRERMGELSNAKKFYELKLQNGQESHNHEAFTSKPRGKYGISYHKVLYSSQSRGAGSAAQNKPSASMSRDKVNSASQNNEIYLPKSFDRGSAISSNKQLFKPIKQGSGALVSPNLRDTIFLEYFYSPKSQIKISPIASKKELYKSKSRGEGSSLAQNKELYSSNSRNYMGPLLGSKELNNKEIYKLKYFDPRGLTLNIESHTSKSGNKGDTLPPKELYKAKVGGNVGHVSSNKELLYIPKFVGNGGPLFQNKEFYTSKSRDKVDPITSKEVYSSKSLGIIRGVVSQNKELYTSKARGKSNMELLASKSMGNGSVVSYYKDLNKFKSHGNRNYNFKKPYIKKSQGKPQPARNEKTSGDKLQCPQNEEFQLCEHCNRTCEDPKPVCLAECSVGCFCKRNLLRDVDGSCVKLPRCSNTWKRMKRTNNYGK